MLKSINHSLTCFVLSRHHIVIHFVPGQCRNGSSLLDIAIVEFPRHIGMHIKHQEGNMYEYILKVSRFLKGGKLIAKLSS